MNATLAALVPALWLGILTSISPCPLASNVAAVSFVGRHAASPARVLWAGLAYSAGRAAAYVAIGAVIVSGLLSVPGVSLFLQEHMNRVLGPLLVVAGLVMLGGWRLPLPQLRSPEQAGERLGGAGLPGAAALGGLFALSFCPVSAGLFFGSLMPLAAGAGSRVLVPAVYGLGTGLPVAVFAMLLAFGSHRVATAYGLLTRLEPLARRATAWTFVLAGAWLLWTHVVTPLLPAMFALARGGASS